MEDIAGQHAEYADDATVWSSDPSLSEACKGTNEDLIREETWCKKWNMSIAAEKTEVLVVPYDGKEPDEQMQVKYGEKVLNITDKTKILGSYCGQQIEL